MSEPSSLGALTHRQSISDSPVTSRKKRASSVLESATQLVANNVFANQSVANNAESPNKMLNRGVLSLLEEGEVPVTPPKRAFRGPLFDAPSPHVQEEQGSTVSSDLLKEQGRKEPATPPRRAFRGSLFDASSPHVQGQESTVSSDLLKEQGGKGPVAPPKRAPRHPLFSMSSPEVLHMEQLLSSSNPIFNREGPAKSAPPKVSSFFFPGIEGFSPSYGPSSDDTPATPLREIPMDGDDFRQNLQKILGTNEYVIGSVVHKLVKRLGSGCFSEVYRLSDGRVIKIPNKLKYIITTKIKLNQRTAKAQYEVLCQMKEQLGKLGLGVAETTFSNDGVILQPFSESFKVFWNETTKLEELTPDTLLLLNRIKQAFKFFWEDGTPVDFRPSNLGIDPANPHNLVIRDFYEMEEGKGDRFSYNVEDLLKHWALHNRAIFEFLDPRP